jgi:hypothetical protein
MPSTYEPIATQTLSSSASSITFTSIPTTYTDLRIVFVGTLFASGAELRMRYNAIDFNYSVTRLRGNGSTASSSRDTSLDSIPLNIAGLTSTPFMVEVDVFSYRSSLNKTNLARSSEDNNGSGWVSRSVGLWRVTDAITSITLLPNSGTISSGSTATLYGIKNA